jgi:hypothetical protein
MSREPVGKTDCAIKADPFAAYTHESEIIIDSTHACASTDQLVRLRSFLIERIVTDI